MTFSSVLPYVITGICVIGIVCGIARVVRMISQGAIKSDTLTGIAMVATMVIGVFRDTAPKEKRNISLSTDKKKDQLYSGWSFQNLGNEF